MNLLNLQHDLTKIINDYDMVSMPL